jgi:two-component sensor histidine kinase
MEWGAIVGSGPAVDSAAALSIHRASGAVASRLPKLGVMLDFTAPNAVGWRRWFHHTPDDGTPWAWGTTLVAALVIALFFTVFGFVLHASGEGAWRNWRGWLNWYGINLVVSVCVTLAIRTLFAVLGAWIGRGRIKAFSAARRALFFAGVPLLGVAIGAPIGLALAGQSTRVWIDLSDGNAIASTVLLSTLISSIFYLVFSAKARAVQAEKKAAEAQLRLLQGQIEPHFLFNTLANVISLIDHDAPKAKQMLESFTDYLRSSLTSLRHEQATLGSELDLVQNYLGLLKTRMEDRLQFSIVIDTPGDDSLRQLRLPPLLLQPLVENAIHHGLEPKVDGGQVRIHACRQGEQLVVEVADDGLGLHAPPRRKGSAGVALHNLRERLLARYGSQASLNLTDARPGTLATLRLPIEKAAA